MLKDNRSEWNVYLTDRQIKTKLEILGFDVPAGFDPFDASTQIQPCSVDLRLGVKFWTQRKQREVDLRRSKLLEMNPRRHWKEHTLAPGEYIRLRPGQLILAHTLELFEIPVDCAGKIEGRSSFARLGLVIHCTGDFINPGYQGHMALQLINFSKAILRLYPGMPICQLALVGLGEIPERKYGVSGLQSKYINDDGGPSYWWRDRIVRRLLDQLREKDYALAVQMQMLELVGGVDVEVIDRLEEYVRKRRSIEVDSADSVLDGFARVEDKARIRDLFVRRVPVGGLVVLLGVSLSIVFVMPFDIGHWIVWSLTTLTAAGAAWSISRHEPSWFTTEKLAELRSQHHRELRRSITQEQISSE